MEEEMSLMELLSIIRKRIGLILIGTLTGILIFAGYTFYVATPEYRSTTQMLVNRTQVSNVIERADIDTNIQLINTYKDILTSPVILDEVIEELNLNTSHQQLSNQLFISSENNSQVFSIQIIDTDPNAAALIANTTASVFQENLSEIMSVDNVNVISQAEANSYPVSPNHTLNLAIGTVVGAVIATVLAFLFEFLDNTVKDDKFITEQLGLINLGNVSEMPAKKIKADKQQNKPERLQETLGMRSKV